MDKLGNYKLGERIGSGAMGSVVKAVAPDGSTVAVKILYPHLASIDEFVRRFNREAGLAQKLSHPNVVKVLDSGCDDGKYYIVMEYVEGRTLLEIMKERGLDTASVKPSEAGHVSPKPPPEESDQSTLSQIRKKSCFTPAETIKIMRQIAGVLHAAKDIGLVHRDIKPQNILIDKKGNAKLLDFGLAKDTEALVSMLSMTGQSIGTPPYMSTEQHDGKRDVDIRSDLYSLGVTAYHMLTGKLPFSGPTISAYAYQHIHEIPPSLIGLNKNIPLNLTQIIDRLLAKDPDDRQQTPEELIEDLNRAERGEPPIKIYKSKGVRQHNPLLIWTIVATSIIVTSACFLVYLKYRASNSEAIITNTISDARLSLSEHKYDEAQKKLNQVIEEFKNDFPEQIREAEKIRDEIPAKKATYIAIQSDENKKKKKTEDEAKKVKDEQIRKNDFSVCKMTIQDLLKEDFKDWGDIEKINQEIKRAYSLSMSQEERNQVDDIKKIVEKKIAERRPWAAVVECVVGSGVKADVKGEAIERKLENAISSNYRLVTRTQITKAINELKFQSTELFEDKNKGRKFAKFIGAEILVIGSLDQIGKKLTIGVRCLNVETGEIVKISELSTEDINEVNDLIAEAAMMISMTEEQKQKYLVDKYDYPRNIANGKDAMGKSNYAEAVKAFRRALTSRFTQEAESFLKIAEEKFALQQELESRRSEYDIAMAEGKKFLDSENWTDAEKAFSRALTVKGYENDKEARDYINTSRGGAEFKRKRVEILLSYNKFKKEMDDSKYLGSKEINEKELDEASIWMDEHVEAASKLLENGNVLPIAVQDKLNEGIVKLKTIKGNLYSSPNKDKNWKIPGINIEFIYVEPGNFKMGAAQSDTLRSDDEVLHDVKLSQHFWISKTEVTQKQYMKISGMNPSKRQGDNLPVEKVTWSDAMGFCKKLNQSELEYKHLPLGYSFRLPTEAEWEYAAKGGKFSKGYLFSGSNNVRDVAWCSINSNDSPKACGTKLPNELGIYDMSGNVWEWCFDSCALINNKTISSAMDSGVNSNPVNRKGEFRIIRGGCWYNEHKSCRNSARGLRLPADSNDDLGFRIVLGADLSLK